MAAGSNHFDYFAIQKVLADYCFALDSKELGQLDAVFTKDVEARYPFPGGSLSGLEAVQNAITGRLGRIKTQHALTTQSITINADGESASAKTYFTATHFGRESRENSSITAYGTYIDDLIRTEGEPTVQNASGKWLISRREVRFFARLGDEKVMDDK